MSITPADIRAAIDVLRQAENETDDMAFELAVDLRDACLELKRETAVTVDLLEMEMLRQVEQAPRMVGTRNFMAVNKYRDRDNHDQIEARVVAAARLAAIDHETGEIDPAEAARQAAHQMRELYVSPSTGAKKGALEALELDPKEVNERERIGRKLHIVETDPE